jgi:hypothetical protein
MWTISSIPPSLRGRESYRVLVSACPDPRTRFVTEVHHINGQGQDSGVVYSEMQGRENTFGDIMALRCVRSTKPILLSV